MLEKKTYKILKYLYRKKNVTYKKIKEITGVDEENSQSKYVSCLFTHHFVEYWSSQETYIVNGIKNHKTLGLKITLEGSAYIEQKRRDAFIFWVPYTITTLVAIAGLLVAIAGLLQSAQTYENQGIDGPSHIPEQTCILDASEK